MVSHTDQFHTYIEAQQDRFLAELFAFLRIPAIAAHGTGLDEAAATVQQRLEQLGATVQRFTTADGAPLLYATLGSGNRRLLVYDHYDVQPAEPFDLWTTPPFEPTIREDKLYARGVADNKGNLMLRLQAIESWQATYGELPCQIIFVIEGEEEIGSRILPIFAREQSELLHADGCLWETGKRGIDNRPEITCGVKGIQYVELVTRGAATDLHSALAAIVPNPAWHLTWALHSLKGSDGHIALPGFYDDIQPPGLADMAALESLPQNDDELLTMNGIPAFVNQVRGIDRLRQQFFAPTCNICGLVAGYTGPGSKTVLPNEARAKIDFRLVPDMQPTKVLASLRAHLDMHGFDDIEIIDHGHELPARSPLDSLIVQALRQAAEETYQTSVALYPSMEGSGPMYPLGPAQGTPVASGAGCGYYGSQIHAPDEHIRLEDYWLGMRWMGAFLGRFAAS